MEWTNFKNLTDDAPNVYMRRFTESLGYTNSGRLDEIELDLDLMTVAMINDFVLKPCIAKAKREGRAFNGLHSITMPGTSRIVKYFTIPYEIETESLKIKTYGVYY